MRSLIPALAFLLALAGCSTFDALGNDLAPVTPVSKADLAEESDRLRADASAAIQTGLATAHEAVAQLRTHVDASDAQIRADAQAADAAQDAAFQRAAADGKTWMEAQLTASAARIEKAARDAQDAASLAITKGNEAKAHADTKAGELKAGLEKAAGDAKVAREETEGDLPWWGALLTVAAGLLPASWGVKKIIVGAIRAFDAQPFRNSRGEPVPEERLADLASTPPKPAA